MKLGAIFVDHAAGFWGTVAGGNEENVFVVRNGDLASDGTLKNNLPLRSFSRAEVEKSLIRSGDILLSTSGDCGKTAYVADVRQRTCVSNFIRRLRVDDRVAFPRFAYHLLRSREIQDGFRRFTRGTTLQNLSLSGAFNALEVALPPIEEQRRIAAVLDAADALRAKRRQALAKLDTLTQAIFIDMFGDPLLNPRNWPRRHLGSLLRGIDSGKSPVCHDRPALPGEWGVLKLGAVTYSTYDAGENKGVPTGTAPDPRHEVRPGDVLFSRKNTRNLVAAAAYVHDTPPRLLLSDLIFRLVIENAELLEGLFLQVQLIQPRLRQSIQALAGGSAGSMPNISKEKLKEVQICLPPIDLQRQFSERANAVRSSQQELISSAAHLDALFASLQQRAFRGEL